MDIAALGILHPARAPDLFRRRKLGLHIQQRFNRMFVSI